MNHAREHGKGEAQETRIKPARRFLHSLLSNVAVMPPTMLIKLSHCPSPRYYQRQTSLRRWSTTFRPRRLDLLKN